MKRPVSNKVSIEEVMKEILAGKPSATITMSPGQWDKLLQAAYDAGDNLIEVDEYEIPVRAYRKKRTRCDDEKKRKKGGGRG